MFFISCSLKHITIPKNNVKYNWDSAVLKPVSHPDRPTDPPTHTTDLYPVASFPWDRTRAHHYIEMSFGCVNFGGQNGSFFYLFEMVVAIVL